MIGLVRPGGIIVMDDFTALEDWDEERRRTRDPLREFWFAHPAVAACEAGVGDDKFGRGTRARALIATRLV